MNSLAANQSADISPTDCFEPSAAITCFRGFKVSMKRKLADQRVAQFVIIINDQNIETPHHWSV